MHMIAVNALESMLLTSLVLKGTSVTALGLSVPFKPTITHTLCPSHVTSDIPAEK